MNQRKWTNHSKNKQTEKQIDGQNKQEEIDSEYSVIFRKTPFGIGFKNRTPFLHELSKKDVFVESVDKNSVGYNKVIIGSKLIKIGNIIVEGMPAHKIMSTFKTINRKSFPVALTFRKPAKVETDHIKHESPLYFHEARAVFVDIKEFYELWRDLSSDILLDSLLILPNINYQWILRPKRLRNNKYKSMLSDAVFQNLLQWKYAQGLLFTSSTKKNEKKSFWYHLSNQLMDLSDPTTFNTTNYKPLKLNVNEYKNNCFRYNVTVNDIQKELCYLTMNKDVMKEILYQSNPSLQIYDKNGNVFDKDGRDRSGSTLSNLDDEEVDDVLDEIAMAWDNQSNKIEYIE